MANQGGEKGGEFLKVVGYPPPTKQTKNFNEQFLSYKFN